jgi:putative intracellular protease/amidase
MLSIESVRAAAAALVAASIAVLASAGCDPGYSAPLAPGSGGAATDMARDARTFVDAMRPRRGDGARPVVAVLALNDATETTDLLLTHAVLQRSDVADVRVVAPKRGAVRLYPALQVEAELDFAGFEHAHPGGADYVVVPAMEPDDDPAVTAWLRYQAGRGARVIGVCAGALVVGNAGLLDGRRFTTHWYYRDRVLGRHAGATWVPDRRYVVDRGVATTTGITASVPTMLALVEAIGGRERAQAVAGELGVAAWSPAHDSARFGLTAARRWGYITDKLAFWRREHRFVDVRDGSDDVALALASDAWSRTGWVEVEAAATQASVRLRSGLVLAARTDAPAGAPRVQLDAAARPVQQLERTLCDIERRYGARRRDRVEQEMEVPATAAAIRTSTPTPRRTTPAAC